MARPKRVIGENKTETITIRVTPRHKEMITKLAWIKKQSVADTLTMLAVTEMQRLKDSGYLNTPLEIASKSQEEMLRDIDATLKRHGFEV